jgi:hypothetical protein
LRADPLEAARSVTAVAVGSSPAEGWDGGPRDHSFLFSCDVWVVAGRVRMMHAEQVLIAELSRRTELLTKLQQCVQNREALEARIAERPPKRWVLRVCPPGFRRIVRAVDQ